MAKAKRPRDPSPARHPVLSHTTPDIRDLLFYILVDSRREQWSNPVYGSAYKDKNGEFPNHKLVLVTPADEDGWQKWYYAADREDQGDYNFSYTHPSGSQRGYPFYTRTYVVRREDVGDYFDNSSGAPMHVVTTGSAVLSAIDEVFSVTGEEDGAPLYTSPSGYTLKKNVNTWNLIIGVLGPNDGANGLQDVDTPDLVTSWISQQDFSPQTVNITAGASIGEEYLAPGAEDPDISFNPEFENFVFTSMRIVRINDKELDSGYVLVERRFEKLCPQSGKKINPITGECEEYTLEILPNSDVDTVCSPVDSNGVGSEVSPLNCDFSKKETKVFRPFDTRTYKTTINYGWPAVLREIEIMDWELVNGAVRNYTRVDMKRNAYNGPTLATITETWHKDAPDPDQTYTMQPTSVHYQGPSIGVSTGPCLHGCVSVKCDYGTNDPQYGLNVGSERSYPRTNFIDWPDELLIVSKVTPSGAGYVKQNIKIERPILGNGITDASDPNYFLGGDEAYDAYIADWNAALGCSQEIPTP